MSLKNFIFTSESVSEGHPDKVADRISDAVLDEFLSQDERSRVACETFVKTGMVFLGGEISSLGKVEYDKLVRNELREIGYNSDTGFDAETVAVLTNISLQSPDIALGVDSAGAGDQGLMFGYACDETEELMPLAIALSHKILKKLAELRHRGIADYLLPDSKGQVSVRYRDKNPVAIEKIVVSTHHKPEVSQDEIRNLIWEDVIKQVVTEDLISFSQIPDANTLITNPTGKFEDGGPVADAGLTGRKIIVDTYGGYGRHGGGAFSGKDPTKVDRSAAYMARYLAKNVVKAGLAKKCEIQLAYAIGRSDPISVYVDSFGTTAKGVYEEDISKAIRSTISLTPSDIIDHLNLRVPIYKSTSSYGHFGRQPRADGSFSWEKTDLADKLAHAV